MLRRQIAVSCLALIVLVACAEGPTAPSSAVEQQASVPLVVPFEKLGSGFISFNRTDAVSITKYVIDVGARSVSSQSVGIEEEARISPDGKSVVFLREDPVHEAFASKWDVYLRNNGVVTRLTYDGGEKDTPNWSYDGKSIVYVQTSNSQALVTQIDLSSLTITRFANKFAETPLQVRTVLESSKGSFVFASVDTTLKPGVPPSLLSPNAIYSARADGSGKKELASSTSVARTPVWSPDGTRIAFGLYGDDMLIRVMNADGTNPVTVAAMPSPRIGFRNGYSLCWTGDGSRILFNYYDEPGNAHIFSVRPDGTDLTQITFGNVVDVNVSCSH